MLLVCCELVAGLICAQFREVLCVKVSSYCWSTLGWQPFSIIPAAAASAVVALYYHIGRKMEQTSANKRTLVYVFVVATHQTPPTPKYTLFCFTEITELQASYTFNMYII